MKKMSFDNDLMFFSTTPHDFDYSTMENPSTMFNMSPNEYLFSPLSTNPNASADFFFPNETTSLANELPTDMTNDDIKIFQNLHDDFANKLFDCLIKFQFDLIEKSMQQFWALTNVHFSASNDFCNNGSLVFSSLDRLSVRSS